nr:fimbrillin family protein [uncultured Bacteroides sp.]
MKSNLLVTAALTAAISIWMASCSNEENNAISQEKGVQLNASINQGVASRVTGTQWGGTEKIGLYMINATGTEFTPLENAANRLYNVDTNGKMTVADGQSVNYPADGSAVKFVAYYPYSSKVANNIYPINLADESVLDHDFIYSAPAAAYDRTQGEKAVTLVFEHQLSRLVLNLVDNNGAPIQGVTAIVDRNTEAQFNLSTGVFSTLSTEKSLDMSISSSQATAIILPGKEGKAVFTYNGKKYTWDTSAITFEQKKQYVYTLKLAGIENTSVIVVGSANITDWVNAGGSVDLEEDQATVPVKYVAPVFSGSLKEEAVISGASLKVDYTDGDGSVVNVITNVSGDAAQGIAVSNKQVTLNKGNGSFTLDVAGTPSSAGLVSFTISVEGTAIGTANATVDAKQAGGVTGNPYTSTFSLPTGATTAAPGQTNAYGGFVEIAGNQYPCLKLGSGKGAGSYTTEALTAGATNFSLYMIAWNGKKTDFTISINGGGTIDGKSMIEGTVDNDPSMTSTGSPYIFGTDPKQSYLQTYTLSGITSASTITIATTMANTDKRVIAYGLNVK